MLLAAIEAPRLGATFWWARPETSTNESLTRETVGIETTRTWPDAVTDATWVGSPWSAVGGAASTGRPSDVETSRTDHRW